MTVGNSSGYARPSRHTCIVQAHPLKNIQVYDVIFFFCQQRAKPVVVGKNATLISRKFDKVNAERLKLLRKNAIAQLRCHNVYL